MKVLDPGNEQELPQRQLAPRLDSLRNIAVGIISNGKEGTGEYFRHLATLLRDRVGVQRVELTIKSNYSAPAEAELMAEVKNWDLLITGVGD